MRGSPAAVQFCRTRDHLGRLNMALILDDIFLAPCKFATWIGRTVRDQAEAELTDESAVHSQLMDLQIRFELGKIDEAEFARQESALMDRLNEIQKYKESQRDA